MDEPVAYWVRYPDGKAYWTRWGRPTPEPGGKVIESRSKPPFILRALERIAALEDMRSFDVWIAQRSGPYVDALRWAADYRREELRERK